MASSQLPPHELLRLLVRSCEMEANENMHLFQRCGFLLTAIVVIASAVVALVDGDWLKGGLSGAPLVVYAIFVVLSFLPLLIAGVYLVGSILPRSWSCTPYDPQRICELCGVTKVDEKWLGGENACSELDAEVLPTLIGELTEATAQNRANNLDRYTLVEKSLRWVVVSVAGLGILGLVHAILFLTVGAS